MKIEGHNDKAPLIVISPDMIKFIIIIAGIFGVGITGSTTLNYFQTAVGVETNEISLTIIEKDALNYVVYDSDGNRWQVLETQVYWNIPINAPFRAVVRDKFISNSPYAGVIDAVLLDKM
jgi:hypothetical protein